MEYRVFFLKPGEKPPSEGSTGRTLMVSPENRQGIVWKGDDGTWSSDNLENRIMTALEIAEHEKNMAAVTGAAIKIAGKNFEIVERRGDNCLVADVSISPAPVYLISFNAVSLT